ncbi:unnamed protein product [Adineta steineri]|uniref:Uncharacterized protein n=1 Tax=Adineta steineri TaxID=433720 RepID=A0A814LBW6_9BILA|nr:unnamed protein product [Adineta steineri]CAF1443404.1 unnamed protein product [Adineta steineri]CAF1518799.1 unnamed protein product [Adineta steineri]CAF3589706.1 unnamed protein product [Adineta steineri]CAF3730540.1 unnamed protein product [Adineta steineri]
MNIVNNKTISNRKRSIICILVTLTTGVLLILGIAIPFFIFTRKKTDSSTTMLPSGATTAMLPSVTTTTTTTSIPSTTKIESINTTSIREITGGLSNTTRSSSPGECTIS